MINDLLMALPMLYYFWSGILIAWSAICGYGIFQVVGGLHHLHGHVRKTDYVFLFGSVAICMTLIALLFVTPVFTSSVVDLLLGVNLWFSIFLAMGTASTLSLWPLICASSSPAVFKKLAAKRNVSALTKTGSSLG